MAVPIPAQNDPQTHSKIAISGCPNQQFWGSRGLPWRSRCLPKTTPKPIQNLQFRGPEISNLGGLGGSRGGLGVVLGAPGESRGAWRAPGGLPGGSRGRPGGVPGGSWQPPGRLPGVSGSPWGRPGGSREALGALLGESGGVLGESREVLEGSWEGSRGVLGVPGAPGPPRRQILDRFGADLGSNLGPGTPENCIILYKLYNIIYTVFRGDWDPLCPRCVLGGVRGPELRNLGKANFSSCLANGLI